MVSLYKWKNYFANHLAAHKKNCDFLIIIIHFWWDLKSNYLTVLVVKKGSNPRIPSKIVSETPYLHYNWIRANFEVVHSEYTQIHAVTWTFCPCSLRTKLFAFCSFQNNPSITELIVHFELHDLFQDIFIDFSYILLYLYKSFIWASRKSLFCAKNGNYC